MVEVHLLTMLMLLLLFSHYADWAGPQPRLWFAEQGKKLKEHIHTPHRENKLEK